MPEDGTGDGQLRLGGQGLRYRLLVGENAVEAWRACLRHIGHPATVPPEALWCGPIWTTWARFKTDIHQQRVTEFADEIVTHGYPHGVMEIDDRWQVHYGDVAFDPKRFPNPRAMVNELHERGFVVTCWVVPLSEVRSGWGNQRASDSQSQARLFYRTCQRCWILAWCTRG